MTHRTVIRLTTVLLAGLLMGCEKDDPTSIAPENRFNVTPLFVGLDPGATQQVTATVGTAPVAVSWESSNPAVATVSATGLVTALTPGFTAITATKSDDGTKLSSNITVLPLLGIGLTNNVNFGPIASSGARYSVVLYRIFVPPGKTNLTVTLSGGSGDADMFVRRAVQAVVPSATTGASTANCASENAANGEVCSIANPQTGTWYISIMVWDAYAGATLRAAFTPP